MEFYDIDPTCSNLCGELYQDFQTYRRAVTATALNLDEDGLRKLRQGLYRNLLGAGNNIQVFVEQLGLKTLLAEDGYEIHLRYL